MVAMETALLINILIYFLGARTKLKEQQKLYQYAEFQSIVISVTIFPLTNPTIMPCVLNEFVSVTHRVER